MDKKKNRNVRINLSAISLMPDANYEPPYEGAKDMLIVKNVDSKEFLSDLFKSIYDELPAPKPRKKQ